MKYVDTNNNIEDITFNKIEAQILDIANTATTVKKHRYHKPAINYWNIPAGFDIESSSAYIKGVKQAWMYEWTFAIGDYMWIGRTWDEYLKLIHLINEYMSEARLVVGVHNLSFEFQFMRKYFTWSEVFSNDERHPIKAVADNIEYRCTATISALPLENLAENLAYHKIEKLVGDLDYSQIRTAVTPLSNQELQYCINDVRIIIYYLEEQIQICGNVTKIPLTNTGRVRQYCREHCLTVTKKDGKKGRNRRYINEMKQQVMTPELYEHCKLAFRGGFTHANPYHNGMTLHDITSYDLTSAYPSVMITEQYPYGAPEYVDLKDQPPGAFDWYIEHRCCLFKAKFINLRLKPEVSDSYISWIPKKMKAEGLGPLNNGRVTSADKLIMYMIDVDYKLIKQCYDWDELYISDLWLWFKRYFNIEFIKCILKFYKDKTTLKGVSDKVIEYLMGKGMLNACYGMVVMDPCREENKYSDDWDEPIKPNINETIDKYNTSMSRFTYYPAGLWVTAHCRRLVWEAILALGDDYVYSDTDSIKLLGDHTKWFEDKNKEIQDRVYAAMDYHKLDKAEAEPLTIKGKSKLIGVWDYEGTYETFKTLGAKRYMTRSIKEYETHCKGNFKPVVLSKITYEITVAGVAKDAVEYIEQLDDPFKEFNMQLKVPKEYTGKLTHTYIDTKFEDDVTDYLGNKCHVVQLSSVHLEPVAYSMNEDEKFTKWLYGYRERRGNYDL